MARRTIKLTLEYDGSDFVGWQFQENGRSVQEEVEKGISQILQERVRITGAGRTDSGVHAKGQVASFATESSLHCASIARGLNGVLPPDVAVLAAEDAPDGFNARFDARSRRYEYIIKLKPAAIWRNFSWHVSYKLNQEIMAACLQTISGMHDFESFCKSEADVKHFGCNVFRAAWLTPDESTLVFDITADRFLHGMVRALVGTMVEIGRGYRPLGDLERVLAAKDRREAGMAAPPQGLFLTHVEY